MTREQLYYVQDSRQTVGNCILWWGKDRRGYTCHIDDAGLYTAAQVKGMRPTDLGYPCELVDKCVSRFVDHQALDHHQDRVDPIRGGVR